MLTTIEAEIDVNGSVTFLEPLTISKKSRAIITLLDVPVPKKPDMSQAEAKPEEGDAKSRQLAWLKAHRNEYAGQYVALDGDILLAHAATLQEIREQIKHRDKKVSLLLRFSPKKRFFQQVCKLAYQLDFEQLVTFDQNEDGIGLAVEVRYSDVSVQINAKIDTGATYSIFEQRFGEALESV